MIILPKKLTTLVSAQDTKESEWDLEQFYQTCEKSLSWRGKDSVARTWKARLKRVFWMKHLFTQTLKPSLTESFEDSWISYLEDSRANHSLKQALKKLPKTQDTFSPTSQKESKSANLELFSSKMSKGYSVAKQEKENLWSNMSEEHWKKWVTEQRSEYSQRVKSERHTRESEFTSLGWPTARTSDAEGGRIETEMTEVGFKSKRHKSNQTFGAKLRDAVETHEENWATPRAGAIDNSRPNNKGGIPLGDQVKRNWLTPTGIDIERTPEGMEKRKKYRESIGRKYVEGCLTEQVKNWSTPTVMDLANIQAKRKNHPGGGQKPPLCQEVKDFPTPSANEQQYRLQGNTQASKCLEALAITGRLDPTKNNTDGKPNESLKLNPDWVENLMGIPQGWTDLEL